VRYLLTPDAIDKAYPEASSKKFQLLEDGNPRIYENLQAGPRVWVAHRAVSQPVDSVLPYMQANGAALKDTVVLDELLPAESAATAGQGGTAEINRYENTRVTIHAALPAPGFVVLADTYYPGWEVRIDGTQAHVYRADQAFRAVWVPAGEHDLEYRFTVPLLRTGTIVSIAALVAVLILVGAGLALHPRPGRRLARRAVVGHSSASPACEARPECKAASGGYVGQEPCWTECPRRHVIMYAVPDGTRSALHAGC
jgi:hypothetical protein